MTQESTVRFLIASDIHAGYAENKQYIGNDSFEALQEVLNTAIQEKVDFILLAGDLFHENHPTRETQMKVVRLLRQYCLNEANTNLEFISDPKINFQHSSFPVVNYLDKNLHVAMPIFTIHGNHDDLSGKGLSALDVLHETGLINLFGKFCDVDQITVSPILLRHGDTKIAIYGIGSQRDDRLARAFSKGHVKFIRPEDGEPDSWFSILLLHQNRPPRSKLRSTKSHLSFKYIPLFFDLIIWGHEHECLIDPDFKFMDPNDSTKGFYIIQPGSTVATSLSIEEAKSKHIGIITVREKQFKLNKIPLKTTRQIIIDELCLETSEPAPKIARSLVRQKNMPDEQLIKSKIEQLLKEAQENIGSQQPNPPRIRLKVIYSGKWLNIPPINGRKFGIKFAGRVANPTDMIFVRVIRDQKKEKKPHDPFNQVLGTHSDDVCSVEEMVNKYFTQCDFKSRLNILSEVIMGKQLQEYSNTEVTTQYKYTAADKAMNDSIKEQINVLGKKVKEIIEQKMEQNMEQDLPLEQQIINCIITAKRERLNRNENIGEMSFNETGETSFFERGYDPSRIITSTPRASQERELRWSESMRIESQKRIEDDIGDEAMITEEDFNISP